MHNAKTKKSFLSGAQSSGQITRFDLLPRVFIERVAARFELGSNKYTDFNYRKGFTDKQFIIDRLNHLQNHFNALLNPQTEEEFYDDNLAGIGWAVAFLMELETVAMGKYILDSIRAERSKHIIQSFNLDENFKFIK